jgi:hypothetical protein
MGARVVALWFLCLIFQGCLHPVLAQVPNNSSAWKITKTEWSSQDEKNYQTFVFGMGQAIADHLCGNVTECLNSKANPYRATDPAGLAYKSDCADFPYYLRAYFAWKNGLPFAFANEMEARNVPGNANGDLRYTKFGNVVVGRRSLVSVNGQLPDAIHILNEVLPNAISSANFRTYYQDSNSDFYPVLIAPDAIHPGVTIYDPNGHIVTVYKVETDGNIYYFDAHPDNSTTAGVFGSKFMRSNPGQGAGFKNWRPLKLVGATLNAQGFYQGGKIVFAANADLADYSSEQYFGNSGGKISDENWSQGKFYSDQGVELDYFEFVRQKLATGGFRTDPIAEFKSLITQICGNLKDRVNSVDEAIQAGLDRKPHPDRLPLNIYGSEGDWEAYSTPGRDAQLKFSFADLLLQAGEFIRKWKAQDPSLSYTGANLAQDLLTTYGNEAMNCRISYVNSNHEPVSLNLEEVRQRLFKLSFDPYSCVEHRWGAVTASELQSCQDDTTKSLWYEREQRLRNQYIRQYDNRMDFNLDELLQPLPGNGVALPPDVDILGLLNSHS